MQRNPADAANAVMRNFEELTHYQIIEAAPDDREDEAREAARAVEELVMAVDDAMCEVQRVIEDGE
jgi:hypothetical protein